MNNNATQILIGALGASAFWLFYIKSMSLAQEEESEPNRIGELPLKLLKQWRTKMKRWPWKHRTSKNKNNNEGSNDIIGQDKKKSQVQFDTQSNYAAATQINDAPKSNVCIGSIFGLDVGGTLAKLVYFEAHDHNHSSEFPGPSSSLYNTIFKTDSSGSNSHHPHHVRSSSTNNQHDFSHYYAINDRKKKRRPYSTDTTNSLLCQPLPSSVKNSPKRKTKKNLIEDEQQQDHHYLSDSDIQTEPRCEMNHAQSMVDLFERSQEHANALEHFYKFASDQTNFGETGKKEQHLSFYSRELQGDFHFISFETRKMESAVNLIQANKLHVNIQEMGATGGGAYKYADFWDEKLGIRLVKQDELDSFVAGLQFVLSNVVGETYTFQPAAIKQQQNETKSSPVDEWCWTRKVQRDSISESTRSSGAYPYLLVMCGTGVSILRIDGPRKYERVSGSTIGGGTYWGLCRLLTDVETFDDVLRIAGEGDPTKVDMMVGDIYGKNSNALEKLKLSSNIVASSFGKLAAKSYPAEGVKEADLARALLLMVTNNIGQVAYLNALHYNTPRIYFAGNFLRQNSMSQQRLAYAIDFWSGGKMEALFLEHEGYFGALGAFLLNPGNNQNSQEQQQNSTSMSDIKSINVDRGCDSSSDGENSTQHDFKVSTTTKRRQRFMSS